MAATFVERCCKMGDYENDGGEIPPHYLKQLLHLWEDDLIDAQYIKDMFSMTTPQADQFDTVLATRPSALLTALNAFNRARWSDTVVAKFEAGGYQWTNFSTAAAIETALGI